MTPDQLSILHHTLGLRPDQRKPYRNHYLAGPGHHAMPDLEALEAAGLMKRSDPPKFCEPGDVLFRCTVNGEICALDNLPPEPERTRYDDYCRSECGNTFAEYLGINKPEYELRKEYDRPGWFRWEYRMVRREGYVIDLHGEWAGTKKDAKASYKAALRASKDRAGKVRE